MHFHSSLLSSSQPFLSHLSPLCFHCYCLILYFCFFCTCESKHTYQSFVSGLCCLTNYPITSFSQNDTTSHSSPLWNYNMFLTQMLFNSFGEYCCKKAFRYIFVYVLTSLASFMCSEDYMAILVI